ncbi:Asp23/Gls24 family envelope stress response protein [Amycolatopsis sp. NPDC048633]|uniref:Asp23/Gls24 family envelope stress response protein n=1 Tax=Amycolatopsis sp. NPDC048633 TaxID=3157095 RepID=UPI0033D8EF2D
MTTATLPSSQSRTAPADEDERGRLKISDRTLERIAARAATEIDGISDAAKASAKVDGDTAVLDVRVSISYPLSVRRTTENVRRHLMQRVGDLTGLTVSRVNLTVTALHGAAADTRRVQ